MAYLHSPKTYETDKTTYFQRKILLLESGSLKLSTVQMREKKGVH